MTRAEGRGARILIADDDPEICNLLSLRLKKRGYEVTTAADGMAALEAVRAEPPDLIILDVMMPKMTGWEVARELRQDEGTKGIKILVLTAIGAQMNALTSPLYGVDGHIDKPFDFAQLEQKLAELLGE